MALSDIAAQLKDKTAENIILIHAFNGIGKTQLCVAYKDLSKDPETNKHTGVYYNAFSEDLFVWENDEGHGNADMRLQIIQSSLNSFHGLLTKEMLEEKLAAYRPTYRFALNQHEDLELGIESVSFFAGSDEEHGSPIKISRGEERIFVWCFFLALFEVDGLADEQDAHFFIDDPVSSLDEYHVHTTAETILKLVESNYLKKKIIVTTHHIGLFSILVNRLKKGGKSSRFKDLTKVFALSVKNGAAVLGSPANEVFLFHLHLLKTLDEAIRNQLYSYHFVLLRQLLENIASFLGTGAINYPLTQIGLADADQVANTINSLSHKDAYQMQSSLMSPAEETLFKDIFSQLLTKYQFIF